MVRLTILAALALIWAGGGANAAGPADPHLIPEARQVLSYLHSIYGKRVLYGQATNHGPGVGEYPNAVATYKAAGKYPALVSIDLYGWNPPHWGSSYKTVLQAYIDGARKWWEERHGLVTMQYHWGSPLRPDGTAWVGDPKDAPHVDVGRVVTPGTEENRAAMEDLRQTADYLQQLADARVPILFRPLHEIDGGWFWWTDRQKPENTAALWRMIYDYLVNRRKLHNLIWVYSAGVQKDPVEFRKRFYPGAQYVDIAGVDIYSNQAGQDYHTDAYQNYYDVMKQVAPGKMLALCECDTVPNPRVMASQGPMWLYCLPWWAPGKDNPPDWVKQVANDPLMVTLDKLPALRKTDSRKH
ncbi:MAG TPA: glycosyl hydrolase [Armatimonadota bacterium]